MDSIVSIHHPLFKKETMKKKIFFIEDLLWYQHGLLWNSGELLLLSVLLMELEHIGNKTKGSFCPLPIVILQQELSECSWRSSLIRERTESRTQLQLKCHRDPTEEQTIAATSGHIQLSSTLNTKRWNLDIVISSKAIDYVQSAFSEAKWRSTIQLDRQRQKILKAKDLR